MTPVNSAPRPPEQLATHKNPKNKPTKLPQIAAEGNSEGFKTSFSKKFLLLPGRITNLKDDIDSLELKCSTGGRIARGLVALVSVALIASLIAIMAFGGAPGLILGGVALGLVAFGFSLILEFTLSKEPDFMRVILFPLTLPFRIIQFIKDYESKQTKMVEKTKVEVRRMAQYVLDNYKETKSNLENCRNLLKSQLKEITDAFDTTEPVELKSNVNVNCIMKQINLIKKHQFAIEWSHKAAKEFLAPAPQSSTV